MIHILTAAERAEFLNDMIRDEMRKEAEASKDWMSQGCTYYRFYHPDIYGHDTDEKVHAYMDQKKIPKQVAAELWQKYVDSE